MDGLRRKQQIHGYQNFRRVIEHGRKHVGAYSILYALKVESGIRVGVIAGRSLGCAVERNRAKRLLREAVRLNSSRIADGCEIVLIARKAILHNTLQDKILDTMRLLEKAGCACKAEGRRNRS